VSTQEAVSVAEEAVDLAPLDRLLDEFRDERGAVIPVLQRAQEIYGYLPTEALKHISRRMQVPLSRLYGVATFYAQFYLHRRGRHIVNICDGTACHVRGASQIVQVLEQELSIKAGETTPDYRLTLEVVYCLGSCALAPVAVLDGQIYGRLVPDKAARLVRALV
jgi:NADH-quinone oxidoreductase subunit E